VLGLNGSGKSTLLKIMAGVDKDFEGEATPMPGLNIGYLPQEPQLDPEQTVRESVEEGMGGVLAAKKRSTRSTPYAEDADFDKLAAEQAELEAIISRPAATTSSTSSRSPPTRCACRPGRPMVGNLSGGEKRRVALCRLLLSKPDMLLLDEPTNHLDAESVDWLEQFLQRFSGTVVAITHDRYFLDNAAEWILELDRGRGIPYKGNYSEWLLQKETRLEQEQKTEDARTKAMKKELEWVRSNPKGRQAKSKARMARFEELSDYDYQKRNETNEIFIPVAERLGHEVIEFTNVSKGFGDRQLIDNLSFKVPAGAIVGIIGPNGAGKSTLFRMIAGKEQPDSGTVSIGKTVQDGLRRPDARRPGRREDRVAGRLRRPRQPDGGQVRDAQSRLHRPLQLQGQRPAEARRQPVRRRTRPPAPGQDADPGRQRADARRAVQRPGRRDAARAGRRAARVRRLACMVISHDRWFLDRIATHILACEGDSQWTFFDGNYQEYEADKKKRLGEEGARPKRVRYKALK
jgi:sulfate-transporting ATPase